MKEYKTPFALRGDWLSCPLPLALDVYWNCGANCLHCPARHLNRTWGEDQRAIDPIRVRGMMHEALKGKPYKAPLKQALAAKKVVMIGRKTDPYQPIEMDLKITQQVIKIFTDFNWPFIIHTKFPSNVLRDNHILKGAGHLASILVEITPGGEQDWELFESKITTPVPRRLRIVQRWRKLGINASVRGEPFIPGYHTTKMFRDMLKRLKAHGIPSYNTYNLHMNDHNLKRLYEAGLDIEKIWVMNQDKRWKTIQKKLCSIADEEGIELGCPDFVNTGPCHKSKVNTCCGIQVERAFTFNTHHWKILLQNGMSPDDTLRHTWEDIGTDEDRKLANNIVKGKPCRCYTMKDAGI